MIDFKIVISVLVGIILYKIVQNAYYSSTEYIHDKYHEICQKYLKQHRIVQWGDSFKIEVRQGIFWYKDNDFFDLYETKQEAIDEYVKIKKNIIKVDEREREHKKNSKNKVVIELDELTKNYYNID